MTLANPKTLGQRGGVVFLPHPLPRGERRRRQKHLKPQALNVKPAFSGLGV
nr:MAG TPA: hypothetical protein [Inoviridae sp.]